MLTRLKVNMWVLILLGLHTMTPKFIEMIQSNYILAFATTYHPQPSNAVQRYSHIKRYGFSTCDNHLCKTDQ